MIPGTTMGVPLALASVAVAAGLGWSVATLGWLLVRRLPITPSVRAPILAQLRLLPLACAVVIVPSQIIAFMRFERTVPESIGPMLLAFAAFGLALMFDGLWASVRSWRATRHVIQLWRREATEMTLPRWPLPTWRIRRTFPVVAVVGVARPELYVSDRVVSGCSDAEIAAILAHERAHLISGDNLLRALFSVTPGVRLFRPLARLIEQDWANAAEEAADNDARQATSALDLASALMKVARMAGEPLNELIPGSALIRELTLETRVRKLLEPPTSTRRVSPLWLPAAGLLSATTLLLSPPALRGLHELFELLTQR